METPAEQKARLEQEAKQEPTPKEAVLGQQVADLQKQIEEQKALDARRVAAKEKVAVDKVAEELAAEADLKNLLKMDDNTPTRENRKGGLDDLSNTELVSVMTDAIQKALEANATISANAQDEKFDRVADSMKNLQSIVGGIQANLSVNQVRSVHKDFDDYREETLAILKETPNMSIERAYKLAKLEKVEKVPDARFTETERPDNSSFESASDSGNRREKREKRQGGGSGTLNFRAMAEEAAKKVIRARGGDIE